MSGFTVGTAVYIESQLSSKNPAWSRIEPRASCILGKCFGAQSFQPLRISLHCSRLYIQSSQHTTVVTCMRVLHDVFKFLSVVNCDGPMLL